MAIGTSRAGVLADATLVDRTRHLTALRLLPFLFVLYIVNYLDRTSVAYAAIGMSRDLGFSDRVFGLGVGVFFIGYLALQIPGSLLAENWSARKTISGSMVVWGSLTVLTAMVHTPMQLYLARFSLGLAEASFFPGGIVYLSHWFIQKDRAKAASNFLAAVPLSMMIGSPVAGEGAFLPCSFWLADSYVLTGRPDAGEALFKRLLALSNDVGLLAEEYDPRARRMLGNFPQALTHMALVNTARLLSIPLQQTKSASARGERPAAVTQVSVTNAKQN